MLICRESVELIMVEVTEGFNRATERLFCGEGRKKGRYQEVIVPLSISLRLQNDLFAYREGEPPIHSTYTLERFLSNHLWAQTTGWSQAEGPLTEPSKGLNPEQTRECRTDWIIQTTLLLIPSTPRPPDFSFL